MDVLLLIVPLSIAFAAAAAYTFWRATDAGQWDDLKTPAEKILIDDVIPVPLHSPIEREGISTVSKAREAPRGTVTQATSNAANGAKTERGIGELSGTGISP